MHVRLSKLNYFFLNYFLIICLVFCSLDSCGSSGNITLLLLPWNWISLIFFPLAFRKANGIRYAILPKHFWTEKEDCTHCQVWCESLLFLFLSHFPPSRSLSAVYEVPTLSFQALSIFQYLLSYYPLGGTSGQSINFLPTCKHFLKPSFFSPII